MIATIVQSLARIISPPISGSFVGNHLILVHFSVLVLSDECDESDELPVTVISIQCCVCTRL